jgi:hypothetical protein
LRTVAPGVAVRGNIDRGELAFAVTANGGAGVGCGLIRHTHEPAHSERSGVMYVNPGSAGPRRFRLPITVARLGLRQSPRSVEWIEMTER